MNYISIFAILLILMVSKKHLFSNRVSVGQGSANGFNSLVDCDLRPFIKLQSRCFLGLWSSVRVIGAGGSTSKAN